MRARAHAVGLAILVIASVAVPRPAIAHDQSFSYITVRWEPDRIGVEVTAHRDVAAPLVGVAKPESLMDPLVLRRNSPRLAGALAAGLRLERDGDALPLEFRSAEPLPRERSVRFVYETPVLRRGPAARLAIESRLFSSVKDHESFVNVYQGTRLVRQDILTKGHPRSEVYARGAAGALAVCATFLRAGIHHIFIGPDHILFIVGLLLLGGGVTRVLRVATAFTFAHSITLAVAALGWFVAPGRIVEPLIALSIVTVGVENLRRRSVALGQPPGAPDWRTRAAFGFGLVHGFGFASVLSELGLPREALGLSLVSFNAGVEVGQACIVLAVTPVLTALHAARPRLASRAVTAASWIIIGAGAFWFVQRVAGKM